MLEGPILVVILIAAVIFIIISSSVLKLHPFLSLIIAAFGVGLGVGMQPGQIIDVVNTGFGGLMGYIGLVIVFGTIIGTILEKSGGVFKMSDVV